MDYAAVVLLVIGIGLLFLQPFVPVLRRFERLWLLTLSVLLTGSILVLIDVLRN